MSARNEAEFEQQFVLRLPQDAAEELRHKLEQNEGNLQNEFFVDLQPDTRKGNVQLGDKVFYAYLFELPCIIESLKTTDRKTFYKSSDISQILVCQENDFEPELSQKLPEKRNLYGHGLTPPLKNVRKRRFRRIKRKKHMERPETEKELLLLFREDRDAVNIRYELVDEAELDRPREQQAAMPVTIKELFGEISDSSDEEESIKIKPADSQDSVTMDTPESQVFSADNQQPTVGIIRQQVHVQVDESSQSGFNLEFALGNTAGAEQITELNDSLQEDSAEAVIASAEVQQSQIEQIGSVARVNGDEDITSSMGADEYIAAVEHNESEIVADDLQLSDDEQDNSINNGVDLLQVAASRIQLGQNEHIAEELPVPIQTGQSEEASGIINKE